MATGPALYDARPATGCTTWACRPRAASPEACSRCSPAGWGIGVFSPAPLDERGNSVRGVRVCEELSLGRWTCTSSSMPTAGPSPVRRTFTLAEMTSKRQRDPAVEALLAREGGRARAFLSYRATSASTEAEQVARAVLAAPADYVVLDLRRVSDINPAAIALLAGLAPRVTALSAAPDEARRGDDGNGLRGARPSARILRKTNSDRRHHRAGAREASLTTVC